MMKILWPPIHISTDTTRVSVALFLLRLVAGIGFVLHGFGKIQAPFSWMGPEAPVPGFLQFLAALSEFGGGLAWILGLLTPLSSAGILVTMSVAAMVHVQKGDGFVQGYELALLYWVIALLLICAGPGRFSLDAILVKKIRK